MSASALPERDDAAALSHTQRLIGVEHGAIYALAKQLPEVNALLEDSFEQLSATFMQIAAQINAYRDKVAAQKLPPDACAELNALGGDITAGITKVVMGLQFQDRVSQNLVITINVLGDLLDEWPQGESSDARDLAFARSVLEKMKLGEFRQRYLDYLLQHGLIDSAESLGLSEAPHAQRSGTEDDGDIDLF